MGNKNNFTVSILYKRVCFNRDLLVVYIVTKSLL